MQTHRNRQRWVFRVASHARHGGGHLARCIVLADALLELNAHVTFVLDEGSNVGLEMIEARGISPAIAGMDFTGTWSGSVLDGYEILEKEPSYWQTAASPMVVIDDFLNPPEGASLVINSGPHAEGTQVQGIPALLGPRYALVSPEFAALPNCDRSRIPEQILVSFGRLDPQNLTGNIIDVFAAMPAWPHLTVVMSGQSEFLEENRLKIEAMAPRATLVVDAPNLVGLLGDADIAIGAGGVSMLERFAAGVPSISTTIVDNQSAFVSGGVRLGATVEPWFDLKNLALWQKLIAEIISDSSKRVRLAARGRSIIDGKGPKRVAEALLGLQGVASKTAAVSD
jgi:UDP-2,4-diacetamido-2,4,6-trideoxy-beta-L-altropyranose hydrolase